MLTVTERAAHSLLPTRQQGPLMVANFQNVAVLYLARRRGNPVNLLPNTGFRWRNTLSLRFLGHQIPAIKLKRPDSGSTKSTQGVDQLTLTHKEGPPFVHDTQQMLDFRIRKSVKIDIFRRPNSFDADDFRMCKFFDGDTDDFPSKCPACHHEFLVKDGSLKSRTCPLCPICGLHTRGHDYYLNYALTNHHYLTDYMTHFEIIECDKKVKQFRKK
jgi:hypothetical protein